MPQQFDIPAETIERVQKGELSFSSYSQYMEPLHQKNVIGVNVAFMLGEWVSVLYFCDSSFFRKYHESIIKFRNLKVTYTSHIDTNLQPFATNIKRLKRDMSPGLSFKPDTIKWGHNSGAAAINFAALAGAKRILLLGFDMDAVNHKTHWHTQYNKPTSRQSFKRFLNYFPAIARDAKKNKIEILNVSPNSLMDAFPKVSLKDVI